MFKFLVGLILGMFVGLFAGFKIAKAQNITYLEKYQVECRAPEKTYKVKFNLGNFSLRRPEIAIKDICATVRALDTCTFLADRYPEERKAALDFWLNNEVTIVLDLDPKTKDYCAFYIPVTPYFIYITKQFGTANCDAPPATLFHETLHAAGFPDHKEDLNELEDEIYVTVAMCFDKRVRLNASLNRKRCSVNGR